MYVTAIRTLALSAALGTAAYPSIAMAETAGSAAEVYDPIQFAVLLELNFGSIVANSTGGDIVLDPADGTRDCGALICAGTFSWSKLALTGSDATVEMTYAPLFYLTGPGDPIGAELTYPGGSGSTVDIVGGSAEVEFGSILHINPDQVQGEYQGQFEVDVFYQ